MGPAAMMNHFRVMSPTVSGEMPRRQRPVGGAILPCARFRFRLVATASLLFLSALLCQAAPYTIKDAHITLTNAANLNGTNGAAITIGADTRIWTNGVVDASTQILANTNLTTAAARLVAHVSSYGFSGLSSVASGSDGIKLTAAPNTDFTVTLTQTNWGTVTYSTNTYNQGQGMVRIPYTLESAVTRTNIANGLSDWLNLDANTTGLSAAKLLSGTVPLARLSGIRTNELASAFYEWLTTNVVASSRLTWAHSALAVDSAGTNFVANFTGDPYRTITATNDVNFIQSTNRAAVRSIVLFVDANGTNRNLTVNSSWKKLSPVHSVVTNGTVGVLSLTVKGTAETDVFAAYTVTQ
jgi:hypothetical protein